MTAPSARWSVCVHVGELGQHLETADDGLDREQDGRVNGQPDDPGWSRCVRHAA